MRAKAAGSSHGRGGSDEAYVIDLCDEILGREGSRQAKFDFLRGDSKDGGPGRTLPVDVFYRDLRLVIEYRERQHTESVAHFDKPDRMTVSGVHRGVQRRMYDERRRQELPRHGIQLVEVDYTTLAHHNKRLVRDREHDTAVLSALLAEYISR